MTDPLRTFDVSFDLGFSFDVQVKAKNGTEAKKKAFQIFLNRYGKKSTNYNIEWYCQDDGSFGGQSAMSVLRGRMI